VVPQRDTLIARAQFPLKLTDGMAMAKPILSTKVGDIPQILGNAGYLVEPDSPDQIAAQIQQIFADFQTAELRGRQAREKCVQCYSTDTMATVLEEILAHL
jgi:glycosyltransferase involved in cell wall biosynthesis